MLWKSIPQHWSSVNKGIEAFKISVWNMHIVVSDRSSGVRGSASSRQQRRWDILLPHIHSLSTVSHRCSATSSLSSSLAPPRPSTQPVQGAPYEPWLFWPCWQGVRRKKSHVDVVWELDSSLLLLGEESVTYSHRTRFGSI